MEKESVEDSDTKLANHMKLAISFREVALINLKYYSWKLNVSIKGKVGMVAFIYIYSTTGALVRMERN